MATRRQQVARALFARRARERSLAKNAAGFDADLRRWAKQQVPADVATLTRYVAGEALTRVVQRMPTDKGAARGSVLVSIGSEPTGDGSPDKGGRGTISRGQSVISQAPPFQVIHIGSNLSYVPILEFGQFVPPNPGPSNDPRPGRKGRVLVQSGFSVQAPRGMFNLTVQELRGIFVR